MTSPIVKGLNMPLDRAAFFAVPPQPRVQSVDVPGLHGHVHVREMTCGEREEFEVAHIDAAKQDFAARLVAFTACDEACKPIFTRADVADISKLPASIVHPIAQASIKLNKLTEEDVSELQKNS